MASIRRASGPEGLGSKASSVASVKDAASAKAGSIGASTGGFINPGFLQFHRFGALGSPLRTEDDFFETRFRALQLLLAMRFQRHAAFIKHDGIFKVDFTLLQTRDDVLELFECRLEGQLLDGRRRLLFVLIRHRSSLKRQAATIRAWTWALAER